MPNDLYTVPKYTQDIAKHPVLWDDYYEFLSKRYAQESADFYLAYHARVDPHKLYTNFIADGAPFKINIDGRYIEEIEEMMADGQDHSFTDLFQNALNAVVVLIDGDHGSDFAKDPANYPKYAAAEFAPELASKLGLRPIDVDPAALNDLIQKTYVVISRTASADNVSGDRLDFNIERSEQLAGIMQQFRAATGLELSATELLVSVENIFTEEAETERALRNALGIPPTAAKEFADLQADIAAEAQQNNGDPTARENRVGPATDPLAMKCGPAAYDNAAKAGYVLTYLQDAKTAQENLDALLAARAPRDQVRAAREALEKAQLGAGGHMVGLGLSDAEAEAFVTAHATGEKPDLDVLVQQTVTDISPQDRAALDAKYEVEPNNPALTEKRLKGFYKTKTMDDLRIAFASANDRATQKDVLVRAVATLTGMATDKGFDIPILPADVLTFLKTAPKAPPKVLKPEAALARVLADPAMIDLRKLFQASTDQKRRDELSQEAVANAKKLVKNYKYGIKINPRDIIDFLGAEIEPEKDKTKDIMQELARLIKAKDAAAAHALADDLITLHQETGGLLADRKPADVLKIVARKMVKDARAQADTPPATDDKPKIASAPDVPPMAGRAEAMGHEEITMATLRKIKWGKFRQIYKIKMDKSANAEFEQRIEALGRKVVKKQDDLKAAFNEGAEFLDWFNRLRGSKIFFKDHKHLCAGLKMALLDWQTEGAIQGRLAKSGTKEALSPEEMLL